MKKTAGEFIANVRESGWPIWIDLTVRGEHSTTMSLEELRDLQYVVNAAVRLAEERESAERRSGDGQ